MVPGARKIHIARSVLHLAWSVLHAVLHAEFPTLHVLWCMLHCWDSAGQFLIKRVVDELKRELPGLTTFVTLSPIPGAAGVPALASANAGLRGPMPGVCVRQYLGFMQSTPGVHGSRRVKMNRFSTVADQPHPSGAERRCEYPEYH
jgi:hypothetical protein